MRSPEGQLYRVETPGLHRPRTLLCQGLNDLVASTLSEVDVIGMCFPAGEKIGPGDRFINEQLGDYRRAKLVAIVTKSETVSREALANQLMEVSKLRDWTAIIPVSAVSGEQLGELTQLLLRQGVRSEQPPAGAKRLAARDGAGFGLTSQCTRKAARRSRRTLGGQKPTGTRWWRRWGSGRSGRSAARTSACRTWRRAVKFSGGRPRPSGWRERFGPRCGGSSTLLFCTSYAADDPPTCQLVFPAVVHVQ